MGCDGFPRKDPSFDPTKYSKKSSARTTTPNMTWQDKIAEPSVTHNVCSIGGVPEEPRRRLSPTLVIFDTPTTTIPHATRPLTFKHNTAIHDAHKLDNKVTRQPLLTAQPQFVEPKQPALNAKPAYIETETIGAADTLRLASLRRISRLYHTKVEARWLTLAELEGGWVSLVPHRAFKEGELVLYIKIDAFLPASDARFGRSNHLQMIDGVLGHRVKTRRFGSGENKVVVQGHVYALEKFGLIHGEIKAVRELMATSEGLLAKPSAEHLDTLILAMYRNENWAAKLGIRKWEESRLQQQMKDVEHPKLGQIPTRVFKKTDVTRVEDCPNLFSKPKYKFNEYQESVKMDGCSMTVYFVQNKSRLFVDLNPLPEQVGPNMKLENGRFGVCSKAVDLNELNEPCIVGYWRTALRYDLPAKLSTLGRSVAIHGELCGEKINKNREQIAAGEVEFFVYSMWDIVAQKYINPRQVVTMAEKLGLKHVPVLGYVKLREICSSHQELKRRAAQRAGEGLVYKCVNDGRSFKVISSTYLLEHNL